MTQGKSILRTRHWREVVKPAVLARDNYECRVKLPGEWKTVVGEGNNRQVVTRRCLGSATTVHHTKGIYTGFDMAHLVASCEPCNWKVGDPRKHNDPPAKLDRSW